jgi:hypothetical protein
MFSIHLIKMMQTWMFCVDADQRTPLLNNRVLLANTADGIGSAIGDNSRPRCAIRFRAKSNNALAQRIDNPLFVGPADAPCTQGRDRLWVAKGHRDAVKFRDAAAPGERLECAGDIRRHNRRSASQEQLADTRQKALEVSVG